MHSRSLHCSRRRLTGAARFAASIFLAALVLLTARPAAADGLADAVLTSELDYGSSITFELDAPWLGPPPTAVSVLFGLPDGIASARRAAEFSVVDGRLTAAHVWMPRGRIVPGSDLAYRFEIETADAAITTAADSLTYIDPSLSWQRASEGLVDIWWYAGGDAVAAEASGGIRQGLDILARDFDLRLTRPTRLVLYADLERMHADLGRGTNSWVGGQVFSAFDVTILYADANPEFRRDLQATVAHEMVHVVIDQVVDTPFRGVPAWVHEGVATVVESAVMERFPYAELMAEAVEENTFVSLRGIVGSFPVNSRRAALAYAQSNSIVTYIIDRWGSSAITALLHAYDEALTDDEALLAAVGVDQDALEREWLTSLGAQDAQFAAIDAPMPAEAEAAAPAADAADPAPAAALAQDALPAQPAAASSTESPAAAPSAVATPVLVIGAVAVSGAGLAVLRRRRRARA